MSGRLPISLLSALAWGTLSNALVPADPTITAPALLKRQNNDNFIGWLEFSSTWYSEDCDEGATWYQDGKYAQCCPTTVASCYAPTACVDGSVIYPYPDQSTTSTIACTDNYNDPSMSICNTAFIFENFDDSTPQTDIVCGPSSLNWSYYRKIPATATEVPSSASSGATSAAPASSPSTPSTPSDLPQPGKKKSGSKAWIAGAVVGPILGLAIIGAIVFFLMRRKKNKQQPQPGAAAVVPTNGQPPVQQYTENKPGFAQQGSYNPNDPYNQQQGYGQPPLSPAPQYTAPYGSPGSPPPQGAYATDAKYGHYQEQPSQPQAAELGGGSNEAPSTSFTAELPGEAAPKK